MEKVDNMKGQMHMGILRKNQKEMLEVSRNKNTFDGLITWLDMAEKKISEFQDMSTDFQKWKTKRKKDKKIKHPRTVGRLQNVFTYNENITRWKEK